MSPDPVLPPVDWTGLRPIAGGPRHYTGPEVGAKVAWKCPACGEENTGVLEQGCVHCGNGGGARHVGVDPRVERPKVVEVEQPIQQFVPAGSTFTIGDLPDLERAFVRWIQGTQDAGPHAAFIAGWHAAEGRRMTSPVTDHPEDVPTVAAVLTAEADPVEAPTEPLEAFPGTPQDRTLLAALTLLFDQFYLSESEEVRTGEWMPSADLSQWITDVRARVEGAPNV
jgi:hypothetical protein